MQYGLLNDDVRGLHAMDCFWTVVVIYNTACSESPSCIGLLQLHYPNVLIVDNSTSDYQNAEFSATNGWRYISMHGNAGISKAYNCAIKDLKGQAKGIIWLDDDTCLNQSYFDELKKALEQNDQASIFLPIVKSEIGISSPCRIDGQFVSAVKDIKDLTRVNITGINAGMAVKISIYDHFRYDENYMVDYVDHAFLRDMKKNGTVITILPAVLKQNFSGRSDDKVSSMNRFKIFLKDYRRFCLGSPGGFYAFHFAVLRRKIYLCLHFKSLMFLKL
jgi:rhamnosyltransferase